MASRCLRIIYNDKESPLIESSGKDNSVSIHKRSICFLVIQITRYKTGLAAAVIKESILQNRQDRYELQNNPYFTLRLVKSV